MISKGPYFTVRGLFFIKSMLEPTALYPCGIGSLSGNTKDNKHHSDKPSTENIGGII